MVFEAALEKGSFSRARSPQQPTKFGGDLAKFLFRTLDREAPISRYQWWGGHHVISVERLSSATAAGSFRPASSRW